MAMELFSGGNIADTIEDRKKYNNLARIAALTFSTPVCAISLRLADRFVLIGRQGIALRDMPRSLDLGEFADAPLWFEDIRKQAEPRLKPLSHATIAYEKPIRFFASAPIVDKRYHRVGLVEVADYWPRSPDKRLAKVLELIADTVTEILFSSRRSAYSEVASGTFDATPDHLATISAGGFSEENNKPSAGGFSVAERFVIDTLISRQSIVSRNGISYLSLRVWRKPLKKLQIDALRAIKEAPTSAFIDAVSQEIAGGLDRLVGHQPARFITHVPCGHSRKDDCLSCLLARQIAANLNLPFVSVFKQNFSHG